MTKLILFIGEEILPYKISKTIKTFLNYEQKEIVNTAYSQLKNFNISNRKRLNLVEIRPEKNAQNTKPQIQKSHLRRIAKPKLAASQETTTLPPTTAKPPPTVTTLPQTTTKLQMTTPELSQKTETTEPLQTTSKPPQTTAELIQTSNEQPQTTTEPPQTKVTEVPSINDLREVSQKETLEKPKFGQRENQNEKNLATNGSEETYLVFEAKEMNLI